MGTDSRFVVIAIAVIALVAAGLTAATATEFRSGSVVSVSGGDVLDDVIAGGDDINFDAHVLGDVIAAGRTVTLGDSGSVDNSFMAFAQKVDVNGVVVNSVRSFAQDVTVRGHVERNVMAFAQSVLIDTRAWVEKDVNAYGSQIIMRGHIGGNLRTSGDHLTISGQVDGDVQAECAKIVILSSAIIGGSLKHSPEADVKVDDGAQILGGVSKLEPKAETKKGYTFGSFLWDVWRYLGSFVVGCVILVLFGRYMGEVSTAVTQASLRTLGVGILFLVGLPIIVVASALTLIGIPAGILVLALWIILLYLADIFVGRALGDWILARVRSGRPSSPFTALAIGLLLITLLLAIPYLGFVIKIAVFALALGGFFSAAYQRRARAA